MTIQTATTSVETSTGKTKTMVLNMGPQHPSTHGVLRILLELDGETVVRQDQWAKAFYVITSGEAEVVRYDARGNELDLEAVLGPGDYFGEIGLLLQPKRTATVRARTALEVTVLDSIQFGELVESSEEAAASLEQTAKARLAQKPPKGRKTP